MKVIVILLSLMGLACAQDPKECFCGMFVSVNMAELEVHRLPAIDLDSCDDQGDCKIGCIREWEYVFNNGGLNFVAPGHNRTIGEESCRTLAFQHQHPNLAPHEVYGYYNVCQGPWVYDGETSREPLCCVEGVYPGQC
ncbi:hypothetical protein SK128_026173 [Halocaridina rubra]|uniref:Uncharacterized protein n=1 Tax=Halocaridina rubra TaxID=373956 RepID=A0AAN8WF73_HALRR